MSKSAERMVSGGGQMAPRVWENKLAVGDEVRAVGWPSNEAEAEMKRSNTHYRIQSFMMSKSYGPAAVLQEMKDGSVVHGAITRYIPVAHLKLIKKGTRVSS